MRFWFKSNKEKERLERVQPFIDYILQMVEKNSDEIQDKVTITGRNPCENEENKDRKYLFKVASVYSFLKARYVDYVYIYIKDRIPEFRRMDKVIMQLTDDDLLYLDKQLLEWL